MKPYCNLASALHAISEDERAIEVFKKAIDLKSGHVDALYNLGGLSVDLGRFKIVSDVLALVLHTFGSGKSSARIKEQLGIAIGSFLGLGIWFRCFDLGLGSFGFFKFIYFFVFFKSR